MSIEALAMAGADYRECNIDQEIVMRNSSHRFQGLPPLPPPYRQGQAEKRLSIHVDSFSLQRKITDADDGDHMKAKIREWAKAVVLMSK